MECVQMENHPYYKVLGALNKGSSGNVIVCLDQRTDVSTYSSTFLLSCSSYFFLLLRIFVANTTLSTHVYLSY